MSDRYNNELAALLTPPPATGVQFSQAEVLTWDNERLANTLDWRGITLTDVPIVEGINALVIRPGDVVGMLGWAPENAKGVGSWWILGKLSNPGEFVADLNVTAKLFVFVTEDEHRLALFGKEGDGDPLWILYYGGADEQHAMRILDSERLAIAYRDGQDVFRTSGVSGSQFFRMFDQAGHEVVGTDGATGVGLSRPWIPYLMNPTHSAEQVGTTYTPATTSASFVDIWQGFNPVFHPRVAYGVSVAATGVTDWRIRVDPGTGLTTVASGSGSASGAFNIPSWGTDALPGHTLEFVLQARNTGGGTTHITINRFYGTQS